MPAPVGLCAEGMSEQDCREALRDLYEYLDGELTVERRERIRLHVEACGGCLSAYDFEVELRRLIARTCQCEAPEALRERVARALRDCDDDGGRRVET
ncbi:MAG: mycothiol system anti-sigma-R factor [Actinobacteria bacterium]|nr:mycothiol system anti-sigma-R factor [Actinomycetota bacterium]